jgi:hypothetical protein
MASDFPLHSVLTTAPILDIRIVPTITAYKKLFYVLLTFLVFTECTFAAEDRIERGKRFADSFFGPCNNVKGNSSRSPEHDDRTTKTPFDDTGLRGSTPKLRRIHSLPSGSGQLESGA